MPEPVPYRYILGRTGDRSFRRDIMIQRVIGGGYSLRDITTEIVTDEAGVLAWGPFEAQEGQPFDEISALAALRHRVGEALTDGWAEDLPLLPALPFFLEGS
jgi:hypothetical protein